MTFPAELAKLYVDQAGQQYIPANGSEGEAFFSWWCTQCQRDKSMREGADLDDCDDDEKCEIIAASFRGEAKEWVYGPDGQPMCTAFVSAGTSVPAPRCERTQDMFNGAAT